MMSSPESEEKTKANSVSERLNECLANVKPADLHQIFTMGCLLHDIEDYDNAITAFTKAIELEPGQMAAYGYRGDSYLKKNDNDNAFQDFTKVIEGNPESKQLQDAYVRRSIVYQFNNNNENANADFSKSVELGLKESEAYANRALVYKQKGDYEHALADYTNAITIDQKNPDLYIQRAWTYWDLNKGVEALQDFATALNLHLDKESVIEFLEGPLHDISNIFLPGEDYDGKFPSDFPLSTRLLELYNDIIEKYPEVPDGHLRRGVYFMSMPDYANAITDFSAYLQLKSDDVFVTFLQGVCYDQSQKKSLAMKNYQQITRQDAIDNIKQIKEALAKYPPINNEMKFSAFLEVIGQIPAIECTLQALIQLFDLETLLDKGHDNPLSQDLLSVARYLDALHADPDTASNAPEKMISSIFYFYPQYPGSLKKALEQDKGPAFKINAKLAIMEYIVSKTNILDWWNCDENIPYNQANGFFYRLHEGEINQYKNLITIPIHFSKQLQNHLIDIKIKKQQEENQARLDERNRVIADLSHSIKNLISTIIDPLENMKKDKDFRPEIIQNALRGANLVREIVNAMNLSFKGSLDDFCYDATHNAGKDSMDLEALVIVSLKYAVGNMFDAKYFSNFVQKYFPTREVFNEAKAEWAIISQISNRQDLMSFLEKYFFNIEVSTGTANQFTVGNEKGSAIKLLILFQELILNAVKYSAFVGKEIRFLNIDLAINPDRISIKVANRFRENLATKTSGIGHIIIDNFSKLLQAQPVIRQADNIYSVEIEFSNVWGKKNENFVRGG